MRIALREAAFCVAIAELAVNMAVTGLGVTSRVAYTDKQGYYEDLLQQAKEDNGNDGFYRVEDSGRKTKNDDSLWMKVHCGHLWEAAMEIIFIGITTACHLAI